MRCWRWGWGRCPSHRLPHAACVVENRKNDLHCVKQVNSICRYTLLFAFSTRGVIAEVPAVLCRRHLQVHFVEWSASFQYENHWRRNRDYKHVRDKSCNRILCKKWEIQWHFKMGVKVTHWKAKVLPWSFLAVRNRASLAGGLLRSRNWCEVCMNFSCC